MTFERELRGKHKSIGSNANYIGSGLAEAQQHRVTQARATSRCVACWFVVIAFLGSGIYCDCFPLTRAEALKAADYQPPRLTDNENAVKAVTRTQHKVL